MITEATGKMIREWCDKGTTPGPDPISAAIASIYAADSTTALKSVWDAHPQYHKDAAFKKATTDRKLALTTKPEDAIHDANMAEYNAQ